MNTFPKRHFLSAALAVCCAIPLFAQGPGGRPGEGRGGDRLDFLAGYLNLTEAQKTQAQAIFSAASSASEAARGRMQSAQEALHAAIKANSSDAELDRLSAAVGTAHGELTAIQAKAEAKFYALLTEEQKARYDSRRGRAAGSGGGSGMGRSGFRR